jgi:hypothetical protein
MSYIGQKPADKLVTSSDMEDGIVTTAKIADSSVTTEKIVADTNFRNIIINGDMSIAQRGTSDSSNTTGGYVICDRWLADIDTQGTWTLSQSTEVPSGQGFSKSFKYDCTTADASPAAGDKINLQQKLEGQMLQYLKKGTLSAESTTLSFWVRSNKTGTYICELQDVDNTRSISKSYTISVADTWEKKILTFAGDTSGALDNDNARSLDVIWYLGAGSNLTSGTLNTSWTTTVNANRAVGQVNLADDTANEWYITGVQLEAGTSASDFEFLPFDVNLQRCERYYQKLEYTSGTVITVGVNVSDVQANADINYKKMRANPTVTLPTAGQTSGTTSYLTGSGAYPSTTGTHVAQTIGVINFKLQGNSYVGLGGDGASWLYTSGNTSIKLDSEL